MINLEDGNIRHKYLFVITPPYSGSTILAKLINTSPNVSTFFDHHIFGEGMWFYRDPKFHADRYNQDYEFDVKKLKDAYDKKWDLSKPVLFDKSPSHLAWAKQIEEYFSKFGDVYFIISLKNPYKYRCRPKENMNTWVKYARVSLKNRRNLKNVLYFTHDDFCENPQNVSDKILKLVPELGTLNVNVEKPSDEEKYTVNGYSGNRWKKIGNYDKYINVKHKNNILKNYKRLISRMGFEYRDA